MNNLIRPQPEVPVEIQNKTPTIRIIAMPDAANPMGDVFGGWILSQMDLAGGAHAYKYLMHRVVTAGIEAMSFYKPVFIGDEISFYTEISKTGNTSITIKIEAWALRVNGDGYVKVTEGLFTYVFIDKTRQPISMDLIKSKSE